VGFLGSQASPFNEKGVLPLQFVALSGSWFSFSRSQEHVIAIFWRLVGFLSKGSFTPPSFGCEFHLKRPLLKTNPRAHPLNVSTNYRIVMEQPSAPDLQNFLS